MKFNIISVVPEVMSSYLEGSIVGRAIKDKKIQVEILNPRDFITDNLRVDDRPYGGGPGMVLRAEPILQVVAKIKKGSKAKKIKTIIFSPRGKEFTNSLASKWLKQCDELVMISGRYEGVDERVRKILKAEEVSIGNFVLTGGELPALVVLDAMTRQIPGVLGKDESVEEKRVTKGEAYTRPEVLDYQGKKYKVPKVLLSGNHKEIDKWREGR